MIPLRILFFLQGLHFEADIEIDSSGHADRA